MSQATIFNKDLVGVVATALVALFLVPVIAYGFVRYAIPDLDGKYLASIERSIDQEQRLSPVEKGERKAFFRALPPSQVCNHTAPEVARYRDGVCAPYSTMWQFNLVKQISGWTLLAGAVVLLVIAGLGALAFVNRHLEYLSFLAGWLLLIFASAAAVIVQGALLVWLSFWLTAFFFNVYAIKLIAIVAIGAAMAVFYAVYCLFKRPPRDTGVDGETVAQTEAPALWAHICDMAARSGTAPPQQIVAGIDTNFFVTEAPLATADETLQGRTLFVSLPLLRVLDGAEADAVLAHELAHFSGGDTAYSAALGPKLVQYDQYSAMMHAGGVTRFAYYLLRLYRVIFEFAHKRDSREREFVADRMAAKQVSARAIVTALIKDNGFGGDVLKITHPEKGWLGAKTTSVKLPGISKEREKLKAVLGAYWQRHQVMRASISAAPASPAA